ncbi:MAG: fibronectin type III domain-containing protein [Vicinamibacterales bacterium]
MQRRCAVAGLALSCVLGPAEAVTAAQIAISWTDNAGDEDGFLVERRAAAGGTFQQIAVLGPNVVGHLDGTVTGGGTYCYRVRAFNLAGASAYTAEACATAAASSIPLAVTLNQASFRRSDTMVATVHAIGGAISAAVDAYVVVQAGGAFLSLQLDGRLVPGLVPIARGIVLPTVDAPFAFPLAGAPPGDYTWLAGVTIPGALSLVAPIASTAFAITP